MSIIKKSIFAMAIVSVFAPVVMVPVANASAATINFGACMSGVDANAKPYLAPGQSGNGPVTKVKGVLSYPNGFDGGMGCSR